MYGGHWPVTRESSPVIPDLALLPVVCQIVYYPARDHTRETETFEIIVANAKSENSYKGD